MERAVTTMLDPPLRLPRYDSACLTHLLADATAAVLGREPSVVPLPEGLRAVVVVVVDGLGRRLLDAHVDAAPALAAAPGTTLDAVFPATTVTNLTSLATGVAPAVHGIAGTVLGIDDRRFVPLSWTWERLFVGADARDEVVPEQLQPIPTLFERMRARGVRPITTLRPDYIGSGLTRASLRGGDQIATEGLAGSLAAATEHLAASSDPTIVYVHHADLDTAGHLAGPGSPAWSAELAEVDATIGRAVDALPPDTAILVTADHGLVRIEDEAFVDVADRPELLEGVRFPAGDPRAPQLHVVDGALDDVVATWRESHGELAEVRTREQAIAEGWFGPGPTGDGAAERLRLVGDVIVAARGPIAWVHRDLDHLGGRMPGHHGSLTPDELEIPAIVLTP